MYAEAMSSSKEIDVECYGFTEDEQIAELNIVLTRISEEVHCLISEAETTAVKINDIIQERYEIPRKQINESISHQNRISMRNHFDGLGKMMIEMKCLKRKEKATWPDAMLYELVFRDYNRTSNGKVKYYKNRPDNISDAFFGWHCTYGRRSRQDTDRSVRKVTELSPIQITTQHWQESLIKRRAKPFEYQLFAQISNTLSLYTSRYFLIVERYKRLRQERTEALRSICISLQLPVEKVKSCSVNTLVSCVEAHLSEYQIPLHKEIF
ncbi:hypothetical protein ACRZ5S_23050 (plasmid) [Vibrio scophthalmi]|uniref:hypothetical protein n=1 Tax=Vibrio scophthalmi TaxID=45658 RepID=UPI003EC13281